MKLLVFFSFAFNLLGAIYRYLLFKNIPFYQQLRETLLIIFLKNAFLRFILYCAATITLKMHTVENKLLQQLVFHMAYISGILVGVSIFTRMLIITSYEIPHVQLLLFIFALNAGFRAITNLGHIVFTGESLIKQILEKIGTRTSSRVSNIFPPPIPEPPKNSSDEDPKSENTEKKSTKEDSGNFKTRQEKWWRNTVDWATIGGAVGSIGGLCVGGYATWNALETTNANKDALTELKHTLASQRAAHAAESAALENRISFLEKQRKEEIAFYRDKAAYLNELLERKKKENDT